MQVTNKKTIRIPYILKKQSKSWKRSGLLKPELISHLIAIAQLGPRNESIKSRNIYMHERIYEMASVSIPENPGGRTAVQMMPSECFRLFHIRLCCSLARVANAGTLHGSHSRNVERQTEEKMKVHTAHLQRLFASNDLEC